MGKEDFRTVAEDVRHILRQRAIRLIAAGKKKKDVADILGVKAGTISDWVKLHRQGGNAALRCKKKGAKNGELKLLSLDQERQIQRMITDKMPDQLKLNFGLWTRKAVSELIFREFSGQRHSSVAKLTKDAPQSVYKEWQVRYPMQLCSEAFYFSVE